MAPVRRCACGCGQPVPTRLVGAAQYATSACRTELLAASGICVKCRRRPTGDGYRTCATCRAAATAQSKARRARAAGSAPRPAPPRRSVEQVFRAEKARLRRELHVDGWAQRADWGQRWGGETDARE